MAKLSLKKLAISKQKYDDELSNLEELIKDKVEFQFFIIHQASDGFVLVHSENMENARLASCINIINEKGKLTYKDYKQFSI